MKTPINELIQLVRDHYRPELGQALDEHERHLRDLRDTHKVTYGDMKEIIGGFIEWSHREADKAQKQWDGWKNWFMTNWAPGIDTAFRNAGNSITTFIKNTVWWAVEELKKLFAWLNKDVNAVSIVGSGTPGGQSVIGAQATGMTARGVPLYLPSGFSAPPSSSVAPRRAGGRDRPAVSLDFRGASFGAGLDEPQLRGWITPILQDALERFETGMMRDTSDLATRGALR
jgi:hypothetical protein